MHGAPFYDAGTSQEAKGIRQKGVLLARRLLRRLLRPMLLELDAELKALAYRQDIIERQFKAVLALGWDHTAAVRRLAVIEDHLEDILAREAAGRAEHAPDGEVRPSIRYPGRDDERGEAGCRLVPPQAQARVS